MNGKIRLQLSAMMFIQFFIWGSWYVTGPNYLATIGFAAGDFGTMYSVGPIAGMIAPFFVGMIADRFFPAQYVLGFLHLLGAGLMYYATTLMQAGTLPRAVVASFPALLPGAKSVLYKLFKGRDLSHPKSSPVAKRIIADADLLFCFLQQTVHCLMTN